MNSSRSRIAFWLSCSAFAAVVVWVAATSVDEIPAHFDAAGTVTRRDSVRSFVLSLGGIGLVLATVFGGGRWWIPRVPAQMINLPSVDAHRYWTNPVRRREFDRMISDDLEWIGAATLTLLAWMTAVSGSATESVSVWLLAVPTVLFVGGLISFAVYRARGGKYRVPD